MVSILSLLILSGADASRTAGRSYHEYVALFLIRFPRLTSLLTFRTLTTCRPSQRHQQACRRTWNPEAPPSFALAYRNCTSLLIEPSANPGRGLWYPIFYRTSCILMILLRPPFWCVLLLFYIIFVPPPITIRHMISSLFPRDSLQFHDIPSFRSLCITKLCNKWNSAIWYNSNKSVRILVLWQRSIFQLLTANFSLEARLLTLPGLSDEHFRLVSGISSPLDNLKLTKLTKNWTQSACLKNLRNEIHMHCKMFVLLPDKCENATPS